MENQKNCAHCGVEIKDAQSSIERDGRTFCSEACANESARQSQRSPS